MLTKYLYLYVKLVYKLDESGHGRKGTKLTALVGIIGTFGLSGTVVVFLLIINEKNNLEMFEFLYKKSNLKLVFFFLYGYR